MKARGSPGAHRAVEHDLFCVLLAAGFIGRNPLRRCVNPCCSSLLTASYISRVPLSKQHVPRHCITRSLPTRQQILPCLHKQLAFRVAWAPCPPRLDGNIPWSSLQNGNRGKHLPHATSKPFLSLGHAKRNSDLILWVSDLWGFLARVGSNCTLQPNQNV